MHFPTALGPPTFLGPGKTLLYPLDKEIEWVPDLGGIR